MHSRASNERCKEIGILKKIGERSGWSGTSWDWKVLILWILLNLGITFARDKLGWEIDWLYMMGLYMTMYFVNRLIVGPKKEKEERWE